MVWGGGVSLLVACFTSQGPGSRRVSNGLTNIRRATKVFGTKLSMFNMHKRYRNKIIIIIINSGVMSASYGAFVRKCVCNFTPASPRS